jgi:aminoglycoside/choline kinase family phosphotransferase
MPLNNAYDTLKQQFLATFSVPAESMVPILSGSASPRRYFRLTGGDYSAVGAIHHDREENDAFVYLSGHFRQHATPVPEVFCYDDSQGCYLMQDLGDLSLFDLLDHHSSPSNEKLLREAIEQLVHIQVVASENLDFDRCYPPTPFNRQAAAWDLQYFKYLFAKLSGVFLDEAALESDFVKLLDALFVNDHEGFMYRDFQSRNIMMNDGKLWFIDYQGGRKGPLAYDVASLLYQSRIALTQELRDRLADHYCDELERYRQIDREDFRMKVKGFALLRLLQNLGAYGYRGIFERKPAFIKPILPALQNTIALIDHLPPAFRPEYLGSLLNEIIPAFRREILEVDILTVTVNSFSYMHGLPKDPRGNGGGFVFDCRALPNPHRDPGLRPFTGKDASVQSWLGDQPEVDVFLNQCMTVVLPSVERYIQRGFQNLQVNFGCTGGKHRSVYCAEMFSRRLLNKGLDVVVHIAHQNL